MAVAFVGGKSANYRGFRRGLSQSRRLPSRNRASERVGGGSGQGAAIMRAAKTSPALTCGDAVEIWRRRAQGEAQHAIAADLGVNQGRVSEVLSGKRFPEAKRLAEPPGQTG